MNEKWDRRFLELAKHIASWSKDPSTQCGAVIVDSKNRIISTGYNGFARGVKDDAERYDDREEKYKRIVHAERNALLFAKCDLSGCTLYTYPFMSCSQCAAMVIQSGIIRCVAPVMPDRLRERWWNDMMVLAKGMFEEADVELSLYFPTELTIPRLHANGTNKAQLLNDLCNIDLALDKVYGYMKLAAPNARDYAPSVFMDAVNEHIARMRKIDAIKEELAPLMLGIDKQMP